MKDLIIEFEGVQFLARISKSNNVTISTGKIGNVCSKDFTHLRGVLGDAIKRGEYNLAIINAIRDDKKVLIL